MMNFLKKQSSYIFLIIVSILLLIYRNSFDYYILDKYFTTPLAIDIMISLIFTYLIFKIYFDNYYYMVLDKNNIITRVGSNKYRYIISKILFLHSILIYIINVFIDFILFHKLNLVYPCIYVFITLMIMVILPKKKEYSDEFLIILLIMMILRYIGYSIII